MPYSIKHYMCFAYYYFFREKETICKDRKEKNVCIFLWDNSQLHVIKRSQEGTKQF